VTKVQTLGGGMALLIPKGSIGMKMTFIVYLLRCADDSLYCGYTKNIRTRVQLHQAGKASKFTRSRLPVKLAYFEKYPSLSAALQREAAIKHFSRRQKLELIHAPKK
jgi:putative endonuclease